MLLRAPSSLGTRSRRLAQSLEGGDRRGHLYPRDDGLLQAPHELAGRTKQRPADRMGVIADQLLLRVCLPLATVCAGAFCSSSRALTF
jgi:hypothetical protein